jgi:GT2 family glycosyltransferase/glycosyltransferase involved in cell wall biosynthesis
MPQQPPQPSVPGSTLDPQEAALVPVMEGFFDPQWYQSRYPDVPGSGFVPIVHFIRLGIAERRDPNPFFDSEWYTERYPDVSAGGLHPLLHYLKAGAAELRDPHPNFDAIWYADQHPEAAGNPLLYHVRVGQARSFPTEKPVHIQDYLPSSRTAPPVPARIVVDVVIPVYRGLAETQRCIASVLADPGKPLGRVIIVEDCSPEPDLVAWLLDMAAGRRIVLVRNPRNVGFVVSVNRGIEAAGTRDVVLLNSDTEVPAGWLGRLTAQACADPRVATVSPFSNNATICSYPHDAGGPIVFGHTLAEIDTLCRRVNLGRWVDVPTTVGFCMYIKRKALREVGTFDAERFAVGYGEENDFCLRASALGWRHRIACDTFVYHQGSVSFGDRVAMLSARAMKLILERYPDYQRDIARHVGLGEIVPFRFALTAALLRQSKLPVILMIVHELGGGVRRNIDMLVERFGASARFLLLEATGRGATLSVPSLANHPSLALRAGHADELLAMLRSMAVSRIHIHHVLGFEIDVRTLVHRLGVPFDLTVHDYYAICPQINLLPWRHSLYCGEPDIAGCNDCIAHRGSNGALDIVSWRAGHAWQFQEADRVLCPSQDVVARLQRYDLAENAVLAPHEAVAAGPWPVRITPPVDGPMRIAVLGTLVNHKGARTVAAVVETADPRLFEFHLIGHTDGPFSQLALQRMRVTGRYDDSELAGLIETVSPHVIWFPAAWPETFSYTLSAAINAGIAVAATRIGSHSERLEGRPYSWLTDVATSYSGWIDLFGEIRKHLMGEMTSGGAPPRREVEDFHGAHYLRPAASPGSGRARSGTARRPRIAVVPERFDTGVLTPCGYIRLLQPLHHPAAARDFEVIVTDAEGIFDTKADIIATQRYAIADVKTADRLAAHARRTGARLVFDLDDDLLSIPRTHPEAAVLRPRARVVRRMLEAADTVFLSTPALARRLSALRPDAVVMENGLDERIWTPPISPLREHPVRILCMGTATHDQDFKLIEPALVRLKAEYGERISIDIVGMTNQKALPDGLDRCGPSANGTRSYPGFVQWLTTIQPAWHIGLAPLLDTAFNQAKSAIKAMDYAALGMIGLASDVAAYRGSLADGGAGLLVQNSAAAWHAALDGLLRDRERRHALAAPARARFLARASLASQAEWRRAAWRRLLDGRRHDAA